MPTRTSRAKGTCWAARPWRSRRHSRPSRRRRLLARSAPTRAGLLLLPARALWWGGPARKAGPARHSRRCRCRWDAWKARRTWPARPTRVDRTARWGRSEGPRGTKGRRWNARNRTERSKSKWSLRKGSCDFLSFWEMNEILEIFKKLKLNRLISRNSILLVISWFLPNFASEFLWFYHFIIFWFYHD